MKRITLLDAKRLLGESLYSRSLNIFFKNQSVKLSVDRFSRDTLRVGGTIGLYHPFVYIKDHSDDIGSYCTCAGAKKGDFCAHAGAVLIKFAVMSGEREKGEEDAPNLLADNLLSSYESIEQSGDVRLTPVIYFEDGQAFASFRIGKSKSYAIRGIREFAERVNDREPHTYGEGFTFDHDINALDSRSQTIAQMIINYARGINALLGQKKTSVRAEFGDIKIMPLSGESFDRIFDLYLGEKLSVSGDGLRLLRICDPEPDISIESGKNGLLLRSGESITYDSGSFGYVIDDKFISRVSKEYSRDVLRLVNGLNALEYPLKLSRRKSEEFGLAVAPKLMPYAGEDALKPVEPFLPEKLEVRFLLDMPERSVLTCRPNFNYDGRFVECFAGKDAYPDIRRDFTAENAALDALNSYFEAPTEQNPAYTLTDEDKMFELLGGGTKTLSEHGEVFISDRLRKLMSGKTPKPVVRAGVSNGMLSLKFDTDEFPAEEMEKLMRSVREKRRYYRLEDGSFLSLENERYADFTKAWDNMGLKPNDLNKEALVPLYKALYLDEALKRDRSVGFERDADYKKLIREFKTVEDGDFPIPEPLDKVLRDYQKTGYVWLRTIDRYGFGGILADDMGLGKTLQLLAFLLALKREGIGGTALIACPASVVATWGSEAEKWAPELKTVLLTGGAAERERYIHFHTDYDLIVTSYDGLRNDAELHAKNNYRVCALDEAQYIKNRETKLKKSVDRLSARTRLALTGTPVENRLSELYSIFDFLMPGYLGSYTSFRQKYELPIAEQGDAEAKETLSKLVRPFVLRRMKKDVLSELPPKTETNCYIQMGERQRKLYVAYAAEVKKKMESASPSDRLMILSMLTRLRRICCDPALVYEGYEDDSCKLDECVRMTEELIENEHRILIFSQFTGMLSRIEDKLSEKGIKTFTLRGDTPLSDRVSLVNAFNNGLADVFLISLKAGGTGINLTGADTVIHYDPWWNIAAQNQATDRCYRIGQERPVQVYKLISSDTIEENIVELQYKKLDLAKVVSENADGGLMNMSSEELLELIK